MATQKHEENDVLSSDDEGAAVTTPMEKEGPAAEDCSNSEVVTKYMTAGEIANFALSAILESAVPGKDVHELCTFGDALITSRLNAVYKKKVKGVLAVEKGIAFPTCISVNNTVCHYSPLKNESLTLKAGDWIKVDLGAHIDGYIATSAHTKQVVESAEEPMTTNIKAFDAVSDALGLCQRLIKAGNTNTQVTTALEGLAEDYGLKAIHGNLIHRMKRFVIDGTKTIALTADPESRVSPVTFEAGETYGIDLCFTTGDNAKPVESEDRTTVFKKSLSSTYRLKMKSSRYVYNEIKNKGFNNCPFSIRALEDEKSARMGVVEGVKSGMLAAYPVMKFNDEGNFIIHVKATLCVLPSGLSVYVSGLPITKSSNDVTVREELKKILDEPLPEKKKNKKKKKKSKK